MKKLHLITLIALLFTTVTFAQKKEKIKGSKVVTAATIAVQPFTILEVEDNIEVYLIKGNTQSVEVECDDNLHDIIKADISDNTLRLHTSKLITGAKQIVVRLTYTPSLKSITAKDESVLYAIKDLELDTIAIKNIDYSKSMLNVKSKHFCLSMNDKTKAELNVKSDSTAIVLSKNANLKALIASPAVKLDMYQKTTATVEGDALTAAIRVDNNAEYNGKKFTAKSLDFTAESYTKNIIMVSENLSLSVSGKSTTEIYGNPTTITVKKLKDSAVILKKEL
jgi:hypothetical protein